MKLDYQTVINDRMWGDYTALTNDKATGLFWAKYEGRKFWYLWCNGNGIALNNGTYMCNGTSNHLRFYGADKGKYNIVIEVE